MVARAAAAPRTQVVEQRPNGQLLLALGRAIRRPASVRWAAVFSLAERAGLDAIPIVITTTFFIGAVVGLLGANILSKFGAQVFVVDLIGISVLREFNVLITAVLLAGRSASAFATPCKYSALIRSAPLFSPGSWRCCSAFPC